MGKFFAIVLVSFFLFGSVSFVLAAKQCDPCDCASNVGCPDCNAGSNLRCLGDPNPGNGVKEGACQDPASVVICPPIEAKTFGELIEKIIDFIFYIAIVVVPIVILYAGFQLITAGGDPRKITAGKQMIIYALIGLAIVMFAKGLIAVIEEVIGVKIGT